MAARFEIAEKERTPIPALLDSITNLAVLLKNKGQLDEALPLFEEEVARLRATLSNANVITLTSIKNLADVSGEVGKMDEAIQLFDEYLTGMGAHLESGGCIARIYSASGSDDVIMRLYRKYLVGFDKIWISNFVSGGDEWPE